EPDDDITGPGGLQLENAAVVDDGADDLAHVVGAPGIVGHDLEQVLVAPLHRVVRRVVRRSLEIRGWEVGEILANHRQARAIVVDPAITHAGNRNPEPLAAPPLAADVLS